MKNYELKTNDSRKSFYGKARIYETETGRFLISYNTAVVMTDVAGNVHRLTDEDDFTVTTLRHVNAFCGLNKAAVLALPIENIPAPAFPKMEIPDRYYRAAYGY